tara:strand:- start:3375 stop:4730 length:1356 start_codon:yes stop_codon:yes gene_type:complete
VIRFILLLIGLSLCLASPVRAQDDPGTEPRIELNSEAPSDSVIAERLSTIFDEIATLSAVEINVRAGVVTLSGTTQTLEAADRAVALAERVDGVVAVENQITRDLSVSNRVSPAFEAVQTRLQDFVRYLPLFGLALGVFAIIFAAGWLISKFDALWQRITPNRFVSDLLSTSIQIVFFAIALIAALTLLDATAFLGTLLGAAGVLGLAIGFAVKDTIENYIASIMLSVRQPFQPNDHVTINDQEGRVIRLTSRATVLMTLDGNHLRIPNSTVFKGIILNYSRNPERRFDFILGIDPEQDALSALATGKQALEALDFVLADPKTVAVIEEIGESTTNLFFAGWLDQRSSDFAKARSVAIASVKDALEAAGFVLPDPSYRISIKGAAALQTEAISALIEQTDDSSMPAPPASSLPSSDIAADTAPDTSIERRVEEERREHSGDLLSEQGPSEI